MKQLSFCLILFITSLSFSQTSKPSQLSIDEIMKGDDFVGYLPTDINWSDNSKDIYFSWNPDKDTIRSTYKVNIHSKKIDKLTFQELKSTTNSGDFSKDYRWKVYEKNGDLFLMDNTSYTVKQITHTNTRESNPKFSGNQKSIIYQQDNNLYQWNITDGSTIQLTDFKSGIEKPKPKLNEQDQWLEDDQLQYFNILEKRKNENKAQKYRREQTELEKPKSVYYGDKNLLGLNISPDLNYIMYRLSIKPNYKKTMVPDFVTQSGYTNDLNARSKVVGSPKDINESWILNLETREHYQIKTDSIKGIYDKPKYLKEYAENPAEYKDTFEKPREVQISNPIFSEDGKAVVNITSEDYKDRWIMTVNLTNGSLKLINHQHDDAWIGGPGVGSFSSPDWLSSPEMGWIDKNSLWFKSEKTGYAHLYTTNVLTGNTKALTQGDFEIRHVTLSKDQKTFYIISNKVSPHEHHFYHLPSKGGKMVKITSKKGGHEVSVSPDETQLAIRYSYANKPWELYAMPNEKGAKMTQLTQSTTDAFKAYDWAVPEIINFTARDGANVPASLYQPNPVKKNGAAVIFVHGTGYYQNVNYWWTSYFREYMFHHFLADQGYTVLAIDFRASDGYGRDWRTAIYRHMGGKDLDDQIDGAKYLVENQGIDKNRLGIYGGSYGGFITLMAMFNYPDTFKSGAALRSVTDWAHYNHWYTANILNTPIDDPKAFQRSSPIYFAEGLKGYLLMLHGMIDTNVHFQDVVRLSQRFIELKKENWDLAVFPLEDHGFEESSSWNDEYRRIFKLFEDTLRE